MKHADSVTKVHPKVLHGGRTTTSIRIKPQLKEALLRFCQANGLSLCHVLEALTTGYLSGKNTQVHQGATLTPIVNLTMQHVVERPRRIYREPIPQISKNDWDVPLCTYCHEHPSIGTFNYINVRGWSYLCRNCSALLIKKGRIEA